MRLKKNLRLKQFVEFSSQKYSNSVLETEQFKERVGAPVFIISAVVLLYGSKIFCNVTENGCKWENTF